MLGKNDGIIVLAETHMRHERMGLRNLFDRLQIAALIFHRELLARPVGSHGFDGGCVSHQGCLRLDAQPETRRHAILEHFEDGDPGSVRDVVYLIVVMPLIRMPVIVAMMMTFSAEEPCTGDIHDQAETRNRDRLSNLPASSPEPTRLISSLEYIVKYRYIEGNARLYFPWASYRRSDSRPRYCCSPTWGTVRV
jgi:hypothetical protein